MFFGEQAEAEVTGLRAKVAAAEATIEQYTTYVEQQQAFYEQQLVQVHASLTAAQMAAAPPSAVQDEAVAELVTVQATVAQRDKEIKQLKETLKVCLHLRFDPRSHSTRGCVISVSVWMAQELRKALVAAARSAEAPSASTAAAPAPVAESSTMTSPGPAPVAQALPVVPLLNLSAVPGWVATPALPAVPAVPVARTDLEAIVAAEQLADLQRRFDALSAEHQDLLLLLSQEEIDRGQLESQLVWYQQHSQSDGAPTGRR